MIREINTRFDIIRNGVSIGELNPVSSPSITMDADSEIKCSLSGEFYRNDSLDYLKDEIQPVLIIDGVEYKYGIYSIGTIRYNRDEEVHSISIEAYDRCWSVKCVKTENILHLDSGTNYLTAIKQLLTTAGIALVLETPTTYTLATDREDWEIGTDYLTIINQLLDEINYNELVFDSNGYAILEPEADMQAKSISQKYDCYNINNLIYDNSEVEIDLFESPNVFVVICDNPDNGSIMKATAENQNPISPLSIVRRGKRIVQVTNVDNIASQSALNQYAQLLCVESMMLNQNITISTGLMPYCRINSVVSLSHPDANGLCREKAISISFGTGGEMRHSLERVMLYG